ncbi:MAG: hypothetical protein ACXWIN_04660, partial [Burkholderiaceae bacterium]
MRNFFRLPPIFSFASASQAPSVPASPTAKLAYTLAGSASKNNGLPSDAEHVLYSTQAKGVLKSELKNVDPQPFDYCDAYLKGGRELKKRMHAARMTLPRSISTLTYA